MGDPQWVTLVKKVKKNCEIFINENFQKRPCWTYRLEQKIKNVRMDHRNISYLMTKVKIPTFYLVNFSKNVIFSPILKRPAPNFAQEQLKQLL